MNILDHIVKKYNLNLDQRMPIEIPDIGRDLFASWFTELGFKVGVELGVERGLYSEVICKLNPEIKLYAIDAWTAYKGYRDQIDQDEMEARRGYAKRRLEPFANCEIIEAFSMDALKQFDDYSLDFVYIDGNHELPHIINDIIQWGKKVRPGGIISGHDYYKSRRLDTKNHVVYAVNMYTQSYRIRPWFLLGTKGILEDEIRDKSRSWFWVKRQGTKYDHY